MWFHGLSALMPRGLITFGLCSQVVAGTNTALQFLVQANCVLDDDTLTVDQLVLDAIVFTPLPTGGNSAPQV